VVDRVDGNHGELLNSLSEKFQFVVDSNKNSSSEILAAILAQHNQTRHAHRVATDELVALQKQLVNVTMDQMKLVAQECPVNVLATIYPRLDAIDATLRANLDKETALENARKDIKKLNSDLKAARDAKAALDTQLNDPWTSLVVMLALALCVADDKDMSNTVCVTVFWIGYKIACWSGAMWPLTPLCALLVPISGVLLMLVSKFGSKRAREHDAKSSADSSAPVVATSAATIDPAAQAVLNSSLQRKFIKQQNYRRFVEDESRMPPPPSYVTGDE
jgi:membrane protein implicated in regulation of membrane protease activity